MTRATRRGYQDSPRDARASPRVVRPGRPRQAARVGDGLDVQEAPGRRSSAGAGLQAGHPVRTAAPIRPTKPNITGEKPARPYQ